MMGLSGLIWDDFIGISEIDSYTNAQQRAYAAAAQQATTYTLPPHLVQQRQLADTAVMERPAKIAQPLPIEEKPIDPIDAEMAAYDALCDELGYAPTAVLKQRRDRAGAEVRSVFFKEHIPQYDKAEVAAYMDSITPSGKVWGWVPFGRREEENRAYLRDGITDEMRRQMIAAGMRNSAPRNGQDLGGTYTKLIPVHILKRIKVVKELFKKDEPKFYVSDYAVPNPDPFVMVRVLGQEIIFGVWDEPGFKDKNTEV